MRCKCGCKSLTETSLLETVEADDVPTESTGKMHADEADGEHEVTFDLSVDSASLTETSLLETVEADDASTDPEVIFDFSVDSSLSMRLCTSGLCFCHLGTLLHACFSQSAHCSLPISTVMTCPP